MRRVPATNTFLVIMQVMLFPTLLPWCKFFSKVNQQGNKHLQTENDLESSETIWKCWCKCHLQQNSGLPAIIGVLPSGLWQRSDSGTPFTLEEDPPCVEICGSTQELVSDGNHKKEPYIKAAKIKKKKTSKNTYAESVCFSTPILFSFLLSQSSSSLSLVPI